jgi:hypothetical protein
VSKAKYRCDECQGHKWWNKPLYKIIIANAIMYEASARRMFKFKSYKDMGSSRCRGCHGIDYHVANALIVFLHKLKVIK